MTQDIETVESQPQQPVSSGNPFAEIVRKQRDFFNSGASKSAEFRIKQLKNLKEAFHKHHENLEKALYEDLRKSKTEAFATEIGIMIAEIEHNMKNIRKWMQPKKVKTPLFFMPGKSRIHYEPFGVSLIISPWNYPVKNLFGPVLGAMTAGNCSVLKPSEVSPYTSAVAKKMVDEFFDPEFMTVVEGGVPETSELLKLKWDYIFFTGGTEIGRIIYQAAAKQLAPCTLELGGKSPTIVDKDINLDVTAKRLCWGKFVNAGQTCVAPDYLLVHKDIKQKLIEKLKETINEFYGENPAESPDLGRIISDRHYNRIKNLIDGDVIFGGQCDESQRYIAPTIIDNVSPDAKVMQQEIFGPILPIIEYENVDEAIAFINDREKPLALYLFSNNENVRRKIIDNTSSGGVCINETIMHMASPEMPFGGVGNSGMGAYNGRFGFDTFSHKKPVMTRSFLFDVKQKYAPFNAKKLNFVKFALKRLI
ncbi:MAG: aldehyde dehydrogenase family protein [Flavobacteriales bacterium]|nr:MAG: aldehyde dehydrogenase family protein [Flavobacteriales bacterium]